MELSSKILSEVTTFMKYARYLPELRRREAWVEIVDRNKQMHLNKFPHIKDEIEAAYRFVYEKKVLPSMRSMQFAGRPIEVNNARLFNCSYLPIDHPDAFSEIMFLLLSGTGVGYSVQNLHVQKLPTITKPTKKRRFLVGDSIEGWSDAIKVLISAYMRGKAEPVFDFSDVRPKGALLVTSGGKAPGPEPLKDCIHHIQKILDRKENGDQLRPIDVHDIACFIADAVLAGGIRRSATISLFDIDDEEMLGCKVGNWWELNPQRARANNSAVILRHRIDRDTFLRLWDVIEKSGSGEPGFILSNDADFGTNPCGEVALRANQVCNLSTINVSDLKDQQDLNDRAKAAAFIATLQAAYTDFHYLRDCWKKITEKEALIGVSMTGVAAGIVMALDIETAADIATEENARVASLIGINKATRVTTLKPEGTSSLVLGTSSGVHAYHNDYYTRRIRVGKDESIYKYLSVNHPELVEDEFFRPQTQAIISVPQKSPDGAITRTEPALGMLERIKRLHTEWIRPGHRKGANTNNVSATVTIKPDEWEQVGDWMWENRDSFTALSVLPYDGGTYVQAPYEDCTKEVYEALMENLRAVDLTQVVEGEDNTNLSDQSACAGGSCEIV
jgi:ribonucleoside-diphosphate reductase alpha chain